MNRQQVASLVVSDAMMTATISINKAASQSVALPRATDAIGSSLRAAFGAPALPADIQALLRRVDEAELRH